MTSAALATEPLLDLEAMATIVHDLVSGGGVVQQDEGWLRARAAQAGLGRHAASALEALRQKLCQGAALLSGDGISVWG